MWSSGNSVFNLHCQLVKREHSIRTFTKKITDNYAILKSHPHKKTMNVKLNNKLWKIQYDIVLTPSCSA